MNNIAISVKNLSKSYRLYKNPAERLKELLHPFGKKYHRNFWALRDINLEIPKGTTFGIIGQNGSGKSTLLQVMTGILQPTTGSVKVNGRVSALLELGSGFNPEFTGRENAFMGGAIMGISREEMEERFDEIAAFADIGDFIEQPVKTYSSGMYVRLAFSVAINVDPDILVVDEVLAVGDMRFQKKCMEKLDDFRDMGKTIIFCSHDMHAVGELCKTAYWIDSGSIHDSGEPAKVISSYVSFLSRANGYRSPQFVEQHEQKKSPNYYVRNSDEVEITKVSIFDDEGKERDVFYTGENLIFEVEYIAKNGIKDPNYSVILFRHDRTPIAITKTNYFKELPKTGFIEGRKIFRVILENIRLNRGKYTFGISVWDKGKKITFANNISKDFEIKSLKVIFGPTEEKAVYFPEVKWDLY